MNAFDIVKTALRLLAILLMAVPIVLTAMFFAATEPFSLKYFYIYDLPLVILSVVFGILIPITTMVFSIRRVRKNKGVLLLFIAAALSTLVAVPTAALVTVCDSICSYTDDISNYGVYDDYTSESILSCKGDLLLPTGSFELSEYQYRYGADNERFYIYTVMHFDSKTDYDQQIENLTAYEVEYDGAHDCRVSTADETNKLAVIWKASNDENSITMLLIYDRYNYSAEYDRKLELQNVEDLL